MRISDWSSDVCSSDLTADKRVREDDRGDNAVAAGPTRGKVAVFVTCYGRFNHPQMVEDLVAVYRHNGIAVQLIRKNQCCGMPKLELGDLDSVDRYKREHLPELAALVAEGRSEAHTSELQSLM